jgi:hypothetical protein
MTILEAPPATTDATDLIDSRPVEPPDTPEESTGPAGGRPPVNTTTAALGAMLSSAAAAWMVAGLFRDFSAHYVALLGVAIGGGFLLAAARGGRAAVAQYLVVPVAVVVGMFLVAGDLSGGKNVLDLVRQAVHNGGLLQPPVSFDPGWKPLLVVLFALVSAAAAGVATGLRRPKLGVAVPAALLIGAAILQPSGSEITGTAVAIVLLVFGLTMAFGAELGADGQLSAGFEVPRLLRAAAIALVLAVGITGLSSLGFLFPQPNKQHTVPPQKPHLPPHVPDRLLFTVKAPRPMPLRLGVLDTYDAKQQAWLLPGYDPARLVRLHPPAKVPDAPATSLPSVTVTFKVAAAEGHAMPSVAGLQSVDGTHDVVAFDPQTQSVSLADRPLATGMTYSVTAAALDQVTVKQLDAAAPPSKQLASYLTIPTPPNAVVALLDSCRAQATKLGANGLFDRLQCVRKGFYDKVIAAGSGEPVDVPPARVGEMLDGADASPYEITAAEAMLARWAGVPSRLGFGYYASKPNKDGGYDLRPVNGAMWLEVNFEGYGWIPIVGVPPKAKPSTSQAQKNQTNAKAPSQIQMMIYIPIRRPQSLLAFEYVRYWAVRVVPPILLLLLLAVAHPFLFKLVRRRRRRRWARRHGLEGRIVAAYVEFRDRARDLTIGDPSATPLKFLNYVEHDTEHRELAWLVTRALWGDLRRDLVAEDAEAAVAMAASVGRRLDRAQPFLNRVIARIARTSLREPYSVEVPNAWYGRKKRGHRLRSLRTVLRRRRRGARLRPSLAGAPSIIMLLAVLLTASCAKQVEAAPRALDDRLVPAQLGAYAFTREKGGEPQFQKAGPDALVSGGLLYSIHALGGTQGSVEVTVFKPDVDVEDINHESQSGHCASHPKECPGHEILKGFQATLGSGHFHRVYYQDQRAYVADLPDQRIYVWFPPGKETMVILDLILKFTESSAADDMFHALLDLENGRTPDQLPQPPPGGIVAATAAPSDSASPSTGGTP